MDDLWLNWLTQARLGLPSPLLTLARAIVVLSVTVHVLLRKRDVGAALSWIGLAWLSPFSGGFLYFVFGINRVRRRAQRMREHVPPPGESLPPAHTVPDVHLLPLEIAAARVTRRPSLRGNAVRPLRCGDEAYPPMLAAIADARHCIALSTYILRDDVAGGRFIDALIAAQRRGVAVRVLLDGIGSGYFVSPAYRRLRVAGVPVARFMHSPLPWRMPFLNLRTHKKILLLDGRVCFTGGMNIAAENVLALRPRHPVRDLHFLVEGPVVGQLAEAFARDWAFAYGDELDGEGWFPRLAEAGEAPARVITSGPDQDLEKIEFIMLEAIACARRRIAVMTPYFLPGERLLTALAVAALRGVEVDVVMPGRSNHVVVDWAARANSVPLLAAECRLWHGKPPFDHSKIMVVDGSWCLIGSANWDMRSLRLNFELDMEVYDTALAARLEAMMVENRAARITAAALHGRSLPVQLRDAAVRLFLPYL